MSEIFIQTFFLYFIVIDPLGNTPLFLSITQHMETKQKIKVAFIYKASNIFMTGKHFDNNYYNFFLKALPRNKNIEVTNFTEEEKFDVEKLENKFDVILLWQNNEFGTPDLINIKNSKIPPSA